MEEKSSKGALGNGNGFGESWAKESQIKPDYSPVPKKEVFSKQLTDWFALLRKQKVALAKPFDYGVSHGYIKPVGAFINDGPVVGSLVVLGDWEVWRYFRIVSVDNTGRTPRYEYEHISSHRYRFNDTGKPKLVPDASPYPILIMSNGQTLRLTIRDKWLVRLKLLSLKRLEALYMEPLPTPW